MYFAIYVTVTYLGSEHMMKEIRRQFLSHQSPLYQSKGSKKLTEVPSQCNM